MSTPLADLDARLAEIESDLDFFTLAIKLRPRLGEVMRWQAQHEVLDLARSFMSARSSRPEAMFGGVLVRLLATLERFIRKLVDSVVEHRVTTAGSYDKLSIGLANRHIVLTGRVLSAIDTPRDHLVFSIDTLIDNLASCRAGNATFRLNTSVFSAVVSGVSPTVLERALENVDVTQFWDAVGADANLVTVLGTKGARATGEQAKDRLKELWKWRNNLAHGGDEEVAVSEAQLRDALAFIGAFATALDGSVKKQLQS